MDTNSIILGLCVAFIALMQWLNSYKQRKQDLWNKQFDLLKNLKNMSNACGMMIYVIDSQEYIRKELPNEHLDAVSGGVTQKSFDRIIKGEGLDNGQYIWLICDKDDKFLPQLVFFTSFRDNLLSMHQIQKNFINDVRVVFNADEGDMLCIMKSIESALSILNSDEYNMSDTDKVSKDLRLRIRQIMFFVDIAHSYLRKQMAIKGKWHIISAKISLFLANNCFMIGGFIFRYRKNYRKYFSLSCKIEKLRKRQVNARKMVDDSYIQPMKDLQDLYGLVNDAPWEINDK